MARPPRQLGRDRLVSTQVLLYCYLEAGVIQTLGSFLAFSLVFHHYGIPLSSLYLTGDFFVSGADDFIVGDKVFDAQSQLDILTEAQTAWWMMIVMSQVFHIFLCKTRKSSIFQHGWWGNAVLNYGVLIELTLMVIVIFVPGVGTVLGSRPFPGLIWLLPLVTWTALLLRSEGVKAYARKHPHAVATRWLSW